jgi:hypothetical protein
MEDREMMTPPTRARLLHLPLIALLLAACTSASSSSPSGSSAPSEALGSQAAEPSVAACVSPAICTGSMPAGDYTSTGTGATISFTLTSSDWLADADTPAVGFVLYADDPGGPAAITVAPWAGVVFSDPCAMEPTETIGTAPADLMGVLTALPDVEAEAPTDVTVGGQPALQVNLTVGTPCADSGGKLWVFQTAGATFNLRESTQARFYVVDAGSVTVVIAIEALGDADYDALIQKAEEVLASMLIEPAP